ncbi:connectin-like [Phlebotomus papatasi]|uniref:connectin-like n=1 Tax=Phlebotomus papatasi TaxID=29031 RepID=UPI0024840D04|nr:connectin-like [Phlebotomus papatasi]
MGSWRSLVFILIVSACLIEGKYRDREAKRQRPHLFEPASTAASVNLCEKIPHMKLVCHCTHGNRSEVLGADCWIFNPDVPKKDPIWGAFYAHSSIETLKFSVYKPGNLTFIPTEIIHHLPNLKDFSVQYAQVTEIGSYALANRSHLSRVEFNNCTLQVLRRHAFIHHPALVEINLKFNQIVEIDRHAFSNLPNLERLLLGYNNITSLHDEVFIHLSKLAELYLQSNLIAILSREVFKGLGNLNVLSLSGNHITFVGDTVFAELWSLEELYLDSNRIEKISERAFDGLNNLKRLNLRHNRLLSLEKGVFTVVPALKSLYLNDNQLETLTYNNFLPIWDNLLSEDSVLGISDNRFICDCRLRWIFELKNRTRNDDLRRSLQDVDCILFDKNSVPEEIFTNAVKEKNDRVPGDYYDDAGYDAQEDTFVFDNRDIDDGQKVQVLRFEAENLPCPEELNDPTEVPMSRESIGMVDMGLRSSAVSWTLVAASIFGLQTLMVAILC